MVGSTYIHILKRNGGRTLLNTAQIASIYTSDIKLASRAGQLEYGKRYPVEQGTLYTIQLMLTSRREMEFIYARADERDEVYNQLVAAVAPAVTIENLAPTVPQLPDELEQPKEPRKPAYPEDLFDNREDYALAMAAAIDQIREERKAKAAAASPPAAATHPPSTKPARKPYTRKPRE